MGIGLDTYWGQFDGLLDHLTGYQSEINHKISGFGAEVIDAGMVDNPIRAREAASSMRVSRCRRSRPWGQAHHWSPPTEEPSPRSPGSTARRFCAARPATSTRCGWRSSEVSTTPTSATGSERRVVSVSASSTRGDRPRFARSSSTAKSWPCGPSKRRTARLTDAHCRLRPPRTRTRNASARSRRRLRPPCVRNGSAWRVRRRRRPRVRRDEGHTGHVRRNVPRGRAPRWSDNRDGAGQRPHSSVRRRLPSIASSPARCSNTSPMTSVS